jgi:hypothetical protein
MGAASITTASDKTMPSICAQTLMSRAWNARPNNNSIGERRFAAAGVFHRAAYASTIVLKPAQAMRLMSKGILAGSIILERRGSSITFFMMRFWSAFDL